MYCVLVCVHVCMCIVYVHVCAHVCMLLYVHVSAYEGPQYVLQVKIKMRSL